jgi:hypothetical protein
VFANIITVGNWLGQQWPLVVAIATNVSAIIFFCYALRQERLKIANLGLEFKKLQLEVGRLQNSPEQIAERRVVYAQLRSCLEMILQQGSITWDQLVALNRSIHDAEFCLPMNVRSELSTVRAAMCSLHTYGRVMKEMQSHPNLGQDSRWLEAVSRDHEAMTTLSAFHVRMPDIFRPYLTLGAESEQA